MIARTLCRGNETPVGPPSRLGGRGIYESSCQVLLVVGTECRRSDSRCGPCPKARIEWHRECWHGGTFGIGEYVVEHAASNVMRVHKCISDAGNDRAATILASEAGAPDICRLGRNVRGDAGFRRCGVFPIIAKLGLEIDKVAERFPKFLFERRSCHHAAVLGWIEPVTRRAAGDVAGPISRPSAHSEAMANRPEHERKKVVRHRHVEVTPSPRPAAFFKSQQDVEYSRVGAARDICN